MFDGSTVLVTGATGSFGRAFTRHVLANYSPGKLILFSRDEMKQWEMANEFGSDPRIRFFIGDVRDRDRLQRALAGVDHVIHAAATKIVPTAEYNPFEAVKTNVLGAMNVIDASLDRDVKSVVALSTDKASAPVNLYGATKLASDKLFVAANAYSGANNTKFAVVRYGNVIGSRGSVIPHFLNSLQRNQPITITDPKMTRFMITLDQGIALVETAFNTMVGGEIFVKKIPSMGIMEIAEALDPGGKRVEVGIRPGEKLHEQMIGREDAPFTYEFDDHFRIFSAITEGDPYQNAKTQGKKVDDDFLYSSDANSDWMDVPALQQLLIENKILRSLDRK